SDVVQVCYTLRCFISCCCEQLLYVFLYRTYLILQRGSQTVFWSASSSCSINFTTIFIYYCGCSSNDKTLALHTRGIPKRCNLLIF
ncbi:hypothetical protein LINGRAHAP2_LOCUS30309, partial [Linum grandiflorum]